MDETCRHYSKWNKPVIEGQMLWDSTHMRYLEWSDSQRQKVEWWLPGSGGQEGMGNQCLAGTVLQDEKLCDWMVVVVVDHGDVLNATLMND